MGQAVSRLDEIQARLDAADADLRAQNAWVDFTDHAHDDVAYLLEQVQKLTNHIMEDSCPRCDTYLTCPACKWPESVSAAFTKEDEE